MADERALGRDGVYRVFHIKGGVAYDGWNLVVTGWTETPGEVLTEAMILPLDPGGEFFRVLHQYTGTGADFALEQHRITGVESVKMKIDWRGDRQLVTNEVPAETLKRMWVASLAKHPDDPYRHVYRGGLLHLFRQTQCRSLRTEMRSWMGGAAFSSE